MAHTHGTYSPYIPHRAKRTKHYPRRLTPPTFRTPRIIVPSPPPPPSSFTTSQRDATNRSLTTAPPYVHTEREVIRNNMHKLGRRLGSYSGSSVRVPTSASVLVTERLMVKLSEIDRSQHADLTYIGG